MRNKGMQLGAVLAAMLLLSTAFVVVANAQGQDGGASDNHISTEETLQDLD